MIKAGFMGLGEMGKPVAGHIADAESANISWIKPVLEVIYEVLAPLGKLNLPSERLLSVVGTGAMGSWLQGCQVLAQDLDISMSTAAA